MTYLPINHYGLIGDLHTAALVGEDGRIAWLPWPRFDSPSLFAALLDAERGGEWLLAPISSRTTEQSYDGETAILLTRFETHSGSAELRDWMSPWDGAAPGHDLCRVLRCTAGEVAIYGRFMPRPDYARDTPELIADANGLHFQGNGIQFFLSSDHSWQIEAGAATFQAMLQAGESLRCVLSSGSYMPVSAVEADLSATQQFWQSWVALCSYQGHWRAAVCRSAITLKLLTYAPTGAIIAAPTTSLPEWIGGVRNWDYRYTWLRDASFTLYTFYLLGYRAEAQAFFHWMTSLCASQDAPLQIMYGVNGEDKLEEYELAHLAGYRDSRPVRVGNGAYNQRQLDVFGGIIDAAWCYEQNGELLAAHEWAVLRSQIDYVCAHWQEPDHGIWEIRGPTQHYTFSKVMCWVTLDRGIRLATLEGWPFDQPRWERTRTEIHASILAHAWNEQVGAFTQFYGSDALDASLLIMPLMGFLPPEDQRIRATIAQIKQHLSKGALVYRYSSDDYLKGDEGAFLLCSFWMVDALAMTGQLEEATERFEQLLSYTSTHGLLAEEANPTDGAALGNYPQAFSHIGLINSAMNLDTYRGRAGVSG